MEISKLDNGSFKVVKMVEQVTEISEQDLRSKLAELTEEFKVSQLQLDELEKECELKYNEVEESRMLLNKIVKALDNGETRCEEPQEEVVSEEVRE